MWFRFIDTDSPQDTSLVSISVDTCKRNYSLRVRLFLMSLLADVREERQGILFWFRLSVLPITFANTTSDVIVRDLRGTSVVHVGGSDNLEHLIKPNDCASQSIISRTIRPWKRSNSTQRRSTYVDQGGGMRDGSVTSARSSDRTSHTPTGTDDCPNEN